MKKKYTITNDDFDWEMIVEVAENEATTKNIRDMVEFWANWEHRLKRNSGDYLKTFLQMLGAECLELVIEFDANTQGVIYQFEDREGWCRMDGEYGIRIIGIDSNPIDADYFTISSF